MKLIRLSVFMVIAGILYACSGINAVDYNNAIINEQNKIIKCILAYADAMGDTSYTKEKFDSIEKAASTQIKASLETVQKMDAFKGNTELRDGAIELFKFYEGAVSNEYREMRDILLKEEVTNEDVERIQAISADITEREGAMDKKFKDVQEKFSKAYNVPIVENELQKDIDKLNN